MAIYGKMLLVLLVSVMPHMTKSKNFASTEPSNTESLQRVLTVTKAMEDLITVFNESIPVEKSLNKILNLSTTIGTLLYNGIDLEGLNNSDVTSNMATAAVRLSLEVYIPPLFQDNKFEELLVKHASFKEVRSTFLYMWGSEKINLVLLKTSCKNNDWIGTLEGMQYALVLLQNNAENTQAYSLKYLEMAYQGMMKASFILSTICENLCNGFQNETFLQKRKTMFLQIIQNIDKNLTSLKEQQRELYWAKKGIEKLLRVAAETYQSNDIIAYSVGHGGFGRLYDEFGYVHHVGVSDATKGYNNSVTYCSSECHHFNNYNGKNIYILRNKINKNGYQKCNYLALFNNKEKTSAFCNNISKSKRAFGDLKDLVNDIISNCNVMGISVVKDNLNYQNNSGDDDAFTSAVYDFPCYGKVNIVIANFPL